MNRAGNNYAALVQTSRAIGMPRHYLADLTRHDLAILRSWTPTRFLWLARPCGTHLYTPEMWVRNERFGLFDGTSTTDAQNWILSNIDYWRSDGARYFIVDNGKVQEVSWGEARRFFTARQKGD